MVAHLTMRTNGVNQAFRFGEGIWLHRKSYQIGYFYPKRPIFLHACAACNELPSDMVVQWPRVIILDGNSVLSTMNDNACVMDELGKVL